MKPEDIPQEVWDTATQHVAQMPVRSQRAWNHAKTVIARAIMAAEKRGEEREREACADYHDEKAAEHEAIREIARGSLITHHRRMVRAHLNSAAAIRNRGKA